MIRANTLSVAGVVCALGALAGACAAQTPVVLAGVSFVDRAALGQITLGNIRGSLGVIDYDNDGFFDLFINDNLGQPKRLFHNVPSSTVPGGRTFVDVSTASGIGGDADGRARGPGGVVVFDYNNDGHPDIFTSGTGTGGSGLLYRNNGDGTFTNVTQAAHLRVPNISPLSVSAVDFDHDGWTDLFTVSNGTPARTMVLLRNNGDGTFTDRPDLLPAGDYGGTVYAHAWTDYDHDGWEDCLVLFNAGRPLVIRNVPDANGGRRFVDATAASGMTTVGPAPMGVALGDVDNDGWIDVAITDAVSGTYYQNRNGVFTRIQPYTTFFGWGTVYLDANNDGWLDNYQAGSYGAANVDWLLRNNGDGTFTEVRAALNTRALASQYCARIDFDNDGREDLITINPGNFISVYHNQSPGPNHWSSVRLAGGRGVNRDAVGARVLLTAGGSTQTRELALGSSYSAGEDPRLHYGLSTAAVVDRIQVIWPRPGTLAQRTETFAGPFPADTLITLSPHALCLLDYNADGDLNPDDLGDYLADYFTTPFLAGPGGYAVDCPENAPPYDAGYKAAYVPGSGQCHPPFPDNVGDYITAYFAGC